MYTRIVIVRHMEHEALAAVWACEHFDNFINGAPQFSPQSGPVNTLTTSSTERLSSVLSDHKRTAMRRTLETVWKKPRPQFLIEHWGLCLQPYKMVIKYQPGADNPTDLDVLASSRIGDPAQP